MTSGFRNPQIYLLMFQSFHEAFSFGIVVWEPRRPPDEASKTAARCTKPLASPYDRSARGSIRLAGGRIADSRQSVRRPKRLPLIPATKAPPKQPLHRPSLRCIGESAFEAAIRGDSDAAHPSPVPRCSDSRQLTKSPGKYRPVQTFRPPLTIRVCPVT